MFAGMERDLLRYARQIVFPRVGAEGQRRLRAATAVVVGAGATGGVIASILVRSGVGRVRILDRDVVEETNLQRQILFSDADAREAAPKAKAAERALRAANPEIEVEGVIADLTPRNAERLLAGASCVLDGTDNFETRLLVNDAAIAFGFPWVYAGVIGAQGHAMALVPERTACFRCYLPDLPAPGTVETCDTAGVLAPAVHAVGGLAAMAGMQILLGALPEQAELVALDVWTRELRRIVVSRDPACRACGARALDFLRGGALPGAVALCGRDSVQVRSADPAAALDLDALAGRLAAAGGVEVLRGPYALRVRAGGLDATVFPDGRAIVRGTNDPGRARAFYAR